MKTNRRPRVTLILRNPKNGGTSIESVFNDLVTELSDSVEFNIVYWTGFKNIIRFLIESRARKTDLFHIGGDIHFVGLMFPGEKTIHTIFDIDHYRKGLTGWRKTVFFFLWYRFTLPKAKSLVAISSATAEAMRSLPMALTRVVIIPLFVSPVFKFTTEQPFGDRPVLLQVGSGYYKNVLRLVSALEGMNVSLIVIGYPNDELIRQVAETRVDVIFLPGISRDKVVECYRRCNLVVFASLHEGFGIPILEAQASGRPLVTSNRSPMTDVAGDGALFVNPIDIAEIRKAIELILSEKEIRQVLVEKGRRNVTKYTLESVARQYHQLYESIRV